MNQAGRSPKYDDCSPLTYDEQKAAEAAFSGYPINPAWSAAARLVYYGIVDAMSARQVTQAMAYVPR